MDAVKYLKEKERMFEYGTRDDVFSLTCVEREFNETVELVEKWSKEHPIKTRQSEFLKHYPNAKMTSDGVLDITPCNIDYRLHKNGCNECVYHMNSCEKEYWSKEVE